MKMLIQRSKITLKCWSKDWNNQFVSKKTKSIKNSTDLSIFELFWLFSINFQLNQLDFQQVDWNWIRFYWFHLDDSDSEDKFGLQKSIKSWFNHDLNFTSGWLISLSLIHTWLIKWKFMIWYEPIRRLLLWISNFFEDSMLWVFPNQKYIN